MAARVWDSLSSSARSRYLGAGRSGKLTGEPFLDEDEVRAYYESGGSLRRARGHLRPRPAWAAPKDPTQRAKVSLLTERDRRSLRTWRRSRSAPRWLPRSSEQLRDDVAAILSEIDAPPDRWRSVTVTPSGSGRYRVVVEVTRRAQPIVTTLPDWAAVSDLGRLLNDHARLAMVTGSEKKRLEKQWQSPRGTALAIAVDISDTDTKARRVNVAPLTPPPTGTARALPKEKKVTPPAKTPPAKAPAKKAKPAKAPAKKAKPAKKAAKKSPARKPARKPARNLRDVSARLLDLEALLKPLESVDAATIALLNGLIKDVEGLIG